MEEQKAKTVDVFDLAVTEYCKEAEQDGFLFAPDKNGCSLEKSNGYNSGFLNGFEKGYLMQSARIAELERDLGKVEGHLTIAVKSIKHRGDKIKKLEVELRCIEPTVTALEMDNLRLKQENNILRVGLKRISDATDGQNPDHHFFYFTAEETLNHKNK